MPDEMGATYGPVGAPQEGSLREAIEKARVAKDRHTSEHTAQRAESAVASATAPVP